MVRCAEDRVLGTFAWHLLWLPWQSWLSLQASSLVGVGFPSPARLAVSFLAIIVNAADTTLRFERPIAESRHDCSDNTHIGGIDDVTPAAFDIETKCSTYRGDFLLADTLSAGFSFPRILDIWILPFRTKS